MAGLQKKTLYLIW